MDRLWKLGGWLAYIIGGRWIADVLRDPNNPEDVWNDLSKVVLVLYLGLIIGGIVILWHDGLQAGMSLLWGLACLSTGAVVGFLFGIPREEGTFAPGGRKPANPRPTMPAEQPPAAEDPQPLRAGDDEYRQRVNTNLEQISDWLTKIIVGIGLVELKNVPAHLQSVAAFLANCSGVTTCPAFAGGLIVYFAILGFFSGYLLTRLFLTPFLARASSAKLSREILKTTRRAIVDLEGRREGPRAPDPATATAAATLASAPGAGETGTADKLLDDARAFATLQMPDKVEKALRNALKQRPDDIRIKYQLALHILFNIQGREQEAIPLIEDVVKSPDAPATAWKTLGFAYLWTADKVPQAVEALEKYLKLYPDDKDARLWLLAAHARQKSPSNPQEQADFLKELRALVESDPAMKQRIRDEAADADQDDFRSWRQVPAFQALIGS